MKPNGMDRRGAMDAEILKEFLAESLENVEQVERDLVALERDPHDLARIAVVFRAFHSIKGTCGFFGFKKLASVTHAGESLLSDIRSGERTLTPDVANALLALVDAVRSILASIEATQEEGDADYAELIASLRHLETAARDVTPSAAAAAVAESTIRVDVHLLDRLMNLVGELVLARNQLLVKVTTQDHAGLPQTAQRLNHITTELQERIMKTRMQPIGNLCNKLPRLVRDVAAACGKEVRLELEGVETELDRTIIEAIRDPLTHLVRNAIDHGIEPPEARRAHGKPAEGRLLVRAFHEGGKVHLEVADDGGGLSIPAIRETAMRRGLVTAERAARLSDRDWANMIFQPGFSTAERVTDVSGRGVGMDVVKTNIERIGGAIDVDSVPGAGATVRVRIPLTLAIVPALIVASGGERFAIPQVNLVELVRVERAQASSRILQAYDVPVLRYRDGHLPLLDLREALALDAAPVDAGGAAGGDDAISVAVLQADGQSLGLVVDAIAASQEIVVKPLGEPLRQIPVFAGATILGDGRVALILDVPGLARHVGLAQRSAGAADAGPATDRTESVPETAPETLVICRAGARWTVAIPQEQIARLEEFPRAATERIGDRAVIQYRGGILPLVSLAALLDLGRAPEAADADRLGSADPIRVVVYERDGTSLGLVVEGIVEIVEERVARRAEPAPNGFAGAAIVHGAVTERLDLDALLAAARFDRHAAPAWTASGGAR